MTRSYLGSRSGSLFSKPHKNDGRVLFGKELMPFLASQRLQAKIKTPGFENGVCKTRKATEVTNSNAQSNRRDA